MKEKPRKKTQPQRKVGLSKKTQPPKKVQPKKKVKPTSKKTDKSDRRWIQMPNTITNKSSDTEESSPKKISYWIDKEGNARLYTKEQLAQCNILMSLNLVLSKAFILIERLQQEDKNTTIGAFMGQDYAQLREYEVSPYANFIELISALPDITFFEFLGFISQEKDPHSFMKMGKEKLQEAMDNADPDNTNFFSSDKLAEDD